MEDLQKFHTTFAECKKVMDAISVIIESDAMELDEAVGERMCKSMEEVRKGLNWLVTSLACCA